MKLRPDSIVTAVALSAASSALVLVSCGSTVFSGDESSSGDAGAAGASVDGGSSGNSGASGPSGNAGSGEAGSEQAGESGQAGGAGGTSAQGGSNAGGSSGDGSITGGEGGEAGGTTVACDPTLAPEDDTCVIDEAYGVFVSHAGDNDEGDGSRANPFATFGKAIEVAVESGKRVYACEGEEPFAESVSIGAEASGIEIFGGFDCGDWTYGAVAKTSVASPTPLALHIVDAENVRIEGVRFEAADGELPGESSVGAFVVNSTGVVLRRVEIVAGDGVDGAPGTLTPFEYPEQSTLNGNPEGPAGMGGGEKVCVCQGTMTSVGGSGGIPFASGVSGDHGLPDFGAGQGGVVADCGAGGTGLSGAAAPITPRAAGAVMLGTATETGWEPGAGADGAIGQPGQGGGGGASRNSSGHGGGGGCGSCGGNGATKGLGGGASIALLSLSSVVELHTANITSRAAGKGGDGVAGQPAQQGIGIGGNSVSVGNACAGGNGGLGANGGASGGGAGGVSIGILWAGDHLPAQIEISFELGAPGVGGIGGEPGVNDGVNGIAQDVFEAP